MLSHTKNTQDRDASYGTVPPLHPTFNSPLVVIEYQHCLYLDRFITVIIIALTAIA